MSEDSETKVTGREEAQADTTYENARERINAAGVFGSRPAKIAPGATEFMAPMRDSVQLAGNLYLPEGPGPFPAVVQRTPYGKDVMFAQAAGAQRYTKRGYAYFVQDVRGKGRSEGFYQAFINDAFDGYDTIEWMARQPWCTGKIGITGGSAMGITANLAATMKPPHLVAGFVIVAPSTRLTGSFVGGAYKQKDSGDWSRGSGASAQTISRAASHYPDSSNWSRTEIAEHRKYINIPMYNYGGWYDIFNEGNVRNFAYLQNEGAKGARGNQKLEMGPFGHGPLSGDLAYPAAGGLQDAAGSNKTEMRWWEYWLKGVDNGVMDEPPVRVYMMAAARKGAASAKNRWLTFANWPPAPRDTPLYLQDNGSLARRAPGEQTSRTYDFDPANPVQTIGGANLTFDRGPMDQRPIGERDDYLRFQTPVLEQDVVIAGPVTVDLWVATDAPDTDFMVKLVDIYPDGYEALILDGALRTRYRNGRFQDDIAMMEPGAPVKISVDLWETAMTFEKGHRLGVHVTSSNAPRFDVNPNTGETPGHDVKPRIARNTIFFGANKASSIRLPVIYPSDDPDAQKG